MLITSFSRNRIINNMNCLILQFHPKFLDFLTRCCRMFRRNYNRRKNGHQARSFRPLNSNNSSQSFFTAKTGTEFQKEQSEGQGLQIDFKINKLIIYSSVTIHRTYMEFCSQKISHRPVNHENKREFNHTPWFVPTETPEIRRRSEPSQSSVF